MNIPDNYEGRELSDQIDEQQDRYETILYSLLVPPLPRCSVHPPSVVFLHRGPTAPDVPATSLFAENAFEGMRRPVVTGTYHATRTLQPTVAWAAHGRPTSDMQGEYTRIK